ncbi:MAG: ribosome maturation factor RimM [Thermodesulfobacteriota bacterium]
MARARYVAVGRVGRPHGVRGEVRIEVGSGMPRGLRGYSRVYLGREGEPEPAAVESVRSHGRFLLVKFRGVGDPEAARALGHAVLYVERGEMPPLEEGEYYHADLLGCRLVDEGGADLGRVLDVFASGAHDLLVVGAPGGREWMLPVLESTVLAMDLEAGEIRVRVPEGLTQ